MVNLQKNAPEKLILWTVHIWWHRAITFSYIYRNFFKFIKKNFKLKKKKKKQTIFLKKKKIKKK